MKEKIRKQYNMFKGFCVCACGTGHNETCWTGKRNQTLCVQKETFLDSCVCMIRRCALYRRSFKNCTGFKQLYVNEGSNVNQSVYLILRKKNASK